jgi:hypothetical protein
MEDPPVTARLCCKDHPDVAAVARCAACSRSLCNTCFHFRMNGKPACARCAYEASTRPARRISLAASFLCLSLGGGFWATRRFELVPDHAVLLVLGGFAAVVVAILVATSGRGEKAAVENRDPDEEASSEEVVQTGSASPYRARVRRVILAASPQVSGSATAVVVIASLAGSAVLLPASVKLPRWLEAEVVLGLWWVIVAGALTVLLYRGFRLRDDYVYFVPWDRPAAEGHKGAGGGGGSSWSDGCGSGCGDLGALDADGCGGALIVLAALAAALGAAWVMVELVMPVVFLLMYWLFMRAIARAARDRRGCAGDLAKSIGWGAAWATIYVAPIAALTWVVHALGRHR